ncbi:ATP-binding protein [Plantactinospora veratri]
MIHLNERLRGLGPAAQRLARTIAVLGPGTPLDRASRLAGLSADDGKREYDRLCRAAILTERYTVDFRHPIIRGAVYDDIEPSQRSDTHLAAARLLHDEDADSGVVAAHLLRARTSGDPWVVDRLCAAADEAMASGLAGTAARYLGRAVQEPPPAGRRCRIRLRHGQALALGEVGAALPELLAAYRQAPDDALRTEVAIALAKTYAYANRLGDAVRLLDRAIRGCRDDRLREQLRAEQLLWATWWADDPRRPDRMRQLDRIAPPQPGVDHVRRLLTTVHAWSLVLRGEPRTEAARAIRPVLRQGVTFADLDAGMEVATMTAFVHLYSDRLSVAAGIFDQADEEFDRNGWRGTHLAFTRTHQATLALRHGRPADAIADAEIALRLADRTGPETPAEQFAIGTLIESLLARGDLDRAVAVRAARDYGTPRRDALALPVPQAVRGALELAQGQHGRAAATLRRTGQWLESAHLLNPSLCPWRFDLARALRHSAPDEAWEIATVGRDRAERFGAPLARGRALRTLATLRPGSAVELLEEAARILSETPIRLEYAQTLADLGAALARTGRDARAPLSAALTLADEHGALALRDSLVRRLAAVGAPAELRPRRADALDPGQRRVARLAADGHSDAEIAHATVLHLDTVGTLLREAHRRLGTTTAAELRRALG